MAHPRPADPRLNYYQQSPVRGQLENPDGTTRSGWRYIQCTDTPNELRVLLPPRTALIYGHILRAELAELAKDKAANWEHIVQIRHLKDRMIRKCTRLSRTTQPKDKPVPRIMFQTVHAPPDFRLKEMERWFRLQGGQVTKPSGEPAAAPYCKECQECMTHQARVQAYAQQGSARRSSSSSKQGPPRGSTPERVARRQVAQAQAGASSHPAAPPVRQEQRTRGTPPPRGHVRYPSAPSVPGYHPDPPRPSQGRKSSEYLRVDHGARVLARSPDPLPIPYRTRPPITSPEPEQVPSETSDVPSPAGQLLDLPISSSPVPSPRGSITPPKASSPPNGLPTIHEEESEHRAVVRRRSSLKKRDSMSRLSVASQSKSVAWAMDRDWVDQLSTYIKTSNEAEVLSAELEKLRVEYHDEIEGMRTLCLKVEESQERVRIETEQLRENEKAVKIQENKVLASSEQIERKQAEFQAKVLGVLEESRRVVQLCDRKRDIHETL
ncbi:hypothetical protein LXA43DRAFT_982732 [Ganoderma leucocontextum]|nr:hypothetical protein LXA43DRAFT_982732 [Ganoderma leucocontextum]